MKIGLLDADHCSFIACYNKVGEELKSWEQVQLDIDSYITRILRITGCTHYIGALTMGKGFRYGVYPDYKGNRKYKDPLPFLKESKQYMVEKWGFVSHVQLEADDIVNICKLKLGEDSFIISPDKDLLYLEGKSYNPKSGEWINVSREEAQLFFNKSLVTGDTVDNIKGLPKKGEAYFDKLEDKSLPNVFNEYIKHFGEFKGVEEFYKNYMCLKIRDSYEDYEIPELKEFRGNYEF